MDEKRTSDSGSSGKVGADGRQHRRRPRERLWTTALASLVAAVPALLVGYTLGFASSALLDLTGDAAAGIPRDYVFSSAVADVFAVSHRRNFESETHFAVSISQALAAVGGMFGGLMAGPVADRWGRKNALVLCGIPFFVGYLVLSYAHYLPTATSFKTVALVGRFLTGVGMGWAAVASSVSVNNCNKNIATFTDDKAVVISRVGSGPVYKI